MRNIFTICFKRKLIIILLLVTSTFMAYPQVKEKQVDAIDKVIELSELCWDHREKSTELAILYGEEARLIADSLGFYQELARVDNYLGAIYLHYIKDLNKSIDYFHQALASAMRVNNTIQMAYAYNNLGDAFYLTGNNHLALEYGELSLNNFQKIKDIRGIAYSYINLGLANRANKKYDIAVDYFNMAISEREKLKDSIGIASANYEIAVSYLEKGEYNLAEKYFLVSLGLHSKLDNKMYIALSLSGLGDVLYNRNDFKNALKKYDESYRINKDNNNQNGIIQSLLGKALVYSNLNQRTKGEEAIVDALSLSNEIGFPFNILKSYKTYAKFYNNLGYYKLANTSYENYLMVYDSLYHVQQYATLKEMEDRFLTTQNLNKINQDLARKKKEKLHLLTILMIVIVLGSALLWKYISNVKLSRKLKQINDSKDKLFSIISHDLKSPFNSILGFSNLLLKEIKNCDQEKVTKYSKFINQLSGHSVDLINNLSSWSRTQRGVIKLNIEKFTIDDLIGEIIELNTIIADKKNIKISSSIDTNIFIKADKEIFRIVLSNILFNAIKFTRENGTIHFDALQTTSDVQISINDNGIGIGKENIAKLFSIKDNYTSLGTNDEKGTGLGLIICKDLVDLHKGKIEVQSEPDKGSTFTIYIPK